MHRSPRGLSRTLRRFSCVYGLSERSTTLRNMWCNKRRGKKEDRNHGHTFEFKQAPEYSGRDSVSCDLKARRSQTLHPPHQFHTPLAVVNASPPCAIQKVSVSRRPVVRSNTIGKTDCMDSGKARCHALRYSLAPTTRMPGTRIVATTRICPRYDLTTMRRHGRQRESRCTTCHDDGKFTPYRNVSTR